MFSCSGYEPNYPSAVVETQLKARFSRSRHWTFIARARRPMPT